MSTKSILPELVRRFEAEILKEWTRGQLEAVTFRFDLMSEADLTRQSAEFLATFEAGLAGEEIGDISGPEWERARGLLEDVASALGAELWTMSLLVDELGLFTAECAIRSREEVDMHDRLALALQDDLTARMVKDGAPDHDRLQ